MKCICLSITILILSSCIGCRFTNSYADIDNKSNHRLENIELELSEVPPVVIKVQPIEPGMRTRVVLPKGFGESSLHFRSTVDGETVEALCGYLESNGMYLATIMIDEQVKASCVVTISLAV